MEVQDFHRARQSCRGGYGQPTGSPGGDRSGGSAKCREPAPRPGWWGDEVPAIRANGRAPSLPGRGASSRACFRQPVVARLRAGAPSWRLHASRRHALSGKVGESSWLATRLECLRAFKAVPSSTAASSRHPASAPGPFVGVTKVTRTVRYRESACRARAVIFCASVEEGFPRGALLSCA